MPLHVVLLRPFQNGGTGELCSVVTDNALWLSIEAHQRIQFTGYARARQAGIGNQAQVFAAAIIIHRKHAEFARRTKCVGHEIHRPALVWAQCCRHGCSAATRPLAAPSPPDGQPLFTVDAVKLLCIHDHTLALKQDADTPISKPASARSNLTHCFVDVRTVRWALPSHSLRIDTDQSAGPALRDSVIPHRLERCVPPLHRCRQGFPSKSFSTTLSSIVSASKRFSFVFSSSSCLSRRASDNSMPPYLAFGL